MLSAQGRSGRPLEMVGRPAAAGLLVVLAGAGVVFERNVRILEARTLATFLHLLQFSHAQGIGVSVIFPVGRSWSGLTLTNACSSTLLIAPFFVIGAALLAIGRLPLRRAGLAVLAASVVIFVLNQARMVVIVLSMRLWGPTTGYERGHLLIGTAISTLAELGGLAVFIALMLRNREHPGERSPR